jgi:RNA polymerase sigma-70 factor (ECF subfamily)
LDQSDFTDLFRRFYPPLVRYACQFTGDSALAADVLQDVFLKLWEDRSRLRVVTSLKALLYTMVRNRALNVIRNGKRRRQASLREAPELSHGTAAEHAAVLDAGDLQRKLYAWILELPDRRREAFMLSRYHGLQHQEIARIMGLSKRTVDTHIMHALQELRQRLEKLQTEEKSP